MYGNSLRGSRESSRLALVGGTRICVRESYGSKATMTGREQSDRCVLPEKLSNKGRGALRSAETVEGEAEDRSVPSEAG